MTSEWQALKWRRSPNTGSLFLVKRTGQKRKELGTVFGKPDGTFGWIAYGKHANGHGYQTEEQAIEGLYDALGL